MSETILEVQDLKKYFKSPKGILHAVDGVSFSLEKGKTLGVVGESGCGKSTLGRCIIRLTDPTEGKVFFKGENVCEFNKKRLFQARREMQIIFQDPFSSLDPKKTVGQTIGEALVVNGLARNQKDAEPRVFELMDIVGLARRFINIYPHEMDGGRRQRVGIARALAVDPSFIVCDEPVSALDVSIQAQILNLLRQLQREMGLTYMFITHDLAVVHHIADDIIVMYMGKVVEQAPADELFRNPIHPYTKALLAAIPVPEVNNNKKRNLIHGEISSPIDPPDACRFDKRCPFSCERCTEKTPEIVNIGNNHLVACVLRDSFIKEEGTK